MFSDTWHLRELGGGALSSKKTIKNVSFTNFKKIREPVKILLGTSYGPGRSPCK